MSGALIAAEAPTRAGVTSTTLARYMTPLRAGDPLGLGLERPRAPPDPDEHDLSNENEHFARSTLDAKQRQDLDETIAKEGYMAIDMVRQFVAKNASAALTEASGLDPEMMMLIDARTNYKTFIVGDNIYTREELYDNFAFHELNVQPEAVFTQQEIGIFPAEQYAMNQNDLCYVARDAGDETVEFITTEDMVGMATRRNYKLRRELLRVIKTKVYVGKQPWRDFEALEQLARSSVRLKRFHCASGGGQGNFFAALLGAPQSTTKLLTDPETLAAERQAREAEDARRAAELRVREAELKEREERLQRMIDEGMERLSEKFAARDAGVEKVPVKVIAKPVVAATKLAVKPAAKPVVKPAVRPAVRTAPPSLADVHEPPADYTQLFAQMFPDDDSVPL